MMLVAAPETPIEVIGDDEEYQSQMNAIRERLEVTKQARKDEMDQLALLKKKKQEKRRQNKKKKLKQSSSAPSLSSWKKDDQDENQTKKKKRRNKKIANSTNALELNIRDAINSIDDEENEDKTSNSTKSVEGSIGINNIDEEKDERVQEGDEGDEEVSLRNIQERREARKLARRRGDGTTTKRRTTASGSAPSSSRLRRLKSDPDSLMKKALHGSVVSPSSGKETSRAIKRTQSKGDSSAVVAPLRRTRSNIDSVKKAASNGDSSPAGTRISPARRQRRNERSTQVDRSTTTFKHQGNGSGNNLRSSTGNNHSAPKHVMNDSIEASAALSRCSLTLDRSTSEGDLSKLCRDEDDMVSSRTVNDSLRQLLEDSSRASRHRQSSNTSHTPVLRSRSASRGRRMNDWSSSRSGRAMRSRSTSRGRSMNDGSSRRGRAMRARDSSCGSTRTRSSSTTREKGSTTNAALTHLMLSNSDGYLGHLTKSYNDDDDSLRRARVRRNISSGGRRSRSRSSSRSRSRSSSVRGKESSDVVELSRPVLPHHKSTSEGDLNTMETSEHDSSAFKSCMNESFSSLASEGTALGVKIGKSDAQSDFKSSATMGRRVARGRGRSRNAAATRVLPSNSQIAQVAVNPEMMELLTSGVDKKVDKEPDNSQESPSRPSLARGHGKQDIKKATFNPNDSKTDWLAVPFAESVPSDFQRAQQKASIESSCKTPFSDSFSDLYDDSTRQPRTCFLGPSQEEARAA